MSSSLIKPGPVMDIDTVLVNVGEFGRYQILLEAIHCLLQIPYTLMILLPYFTQDSPAWKCAVNSTRCNVTGELPSTDKLRCTIPRRDWEYALPKDYSVVTEVSTYFCIIMRILVNCMKNFGRHPHGFTLSLCDYVG